jgi:hypothetical protein
VLDFEPAFFAVPADFDAPVLLIAELFEVAVFFAPPVFAVAERFPPWFDIEADLDADFFAVPDFAAAFLPEPVFDPPFAERESEVDRDFLLVELFAVAIVFVSKDF